MRVTSLALHLSLASRLAFSSSTCQYRTANYRTHGLPQQCLASLDPPEATPHANCTENLEEAAVNTTGSEVGKTTVVETTAGHGTEEASTGRATIVSIPADQNDDSVLGDENFLSFEEWKKRNLASAGQQQALGDRGVREPRRRPGGMNNDIDSIGEDPEIDLSFGFDTPYVENKPGAGKGQVPEESGAPKGQTRSKMAGKTSKERFNYASFDCAATVHKTQPGVKGANSILVENKDSYMLSKCDGEKFFIVELCDDILVDTVVLANYEFFSSMFRQFRVSVSDRYPIKASGWKELGLFEGRNTREVQAFLVPPMQIWARYIKVDILSHYGNEYYCPLSLFRVHGTTMAEEFKAEIERVQHPQGDEDVDEVALEEVTPEAMVPAVVNSGEENNITEDTAGSAETMESATEVDLGAPVRDIASRTVKEECISPSKNPTFDKIKEVSTCDAFLPTLPASSMVYAEFFTSIPVIPTAVLAKQPPGTSITAPENSPSSQAHHTRSDISSEVPKKRASQTPKEHASKPTQTNGNGTPAHHPPPPPPPQATSQENFFKTIHKRLQLLEANATLSLQYIEEQSKMLRDAFAKVEKKQAVRTAQFLDALNSTVWKELVGFRNQYDQLWQSTVIALQNHRSQSDQDVLDLNEQISLLAEEVVYQRRMGYVQSTLLLVCILLIIFKQNYTFENPLVHSLRQRGNFRFLESPPTSPLRGADIGGRRQHMRGESIDSITSPSPIIDFTPPTPESSTRTTPAPDSQVIRSSPATPRGERDPEEFQTNWRGFPIKNKKKWKKKSSPLKSGESSAASSARNSPAPPTVGERKKMKSRSPGSSQEELYVPNTPDPCWEYTP